MPKYNTKLTSTSKSINNKLKQRKLKPQDNHKQPIINPTNLLNHKRKTNEQSQSTTNLQNKNKQIKTN